MAFEQFFYGDYLHAPRSVAIKSIQKTYTLGANQRVHILRVSWSLEGKLIASTTIEPQQDILSQLSDLIDAYSVNGQSAGFPGTPFMIDTARTIGGVLVTSPINHGQIMGAEGVTYLKYSFSLQADFPYANLGQVLEFTESVSFTSNYGGPIFAERIPVQGRPILQQVTEQSWYFACQSGSITGAFQYPRVPDPIFGPSYIRTGGNAGIVITPESPVMSRGTPISFPVKYKYDFISPDPLFGSPNIIG